MSILRKSLSELTASDIDDLLTSGAAETAELEFKGQLPAKNSQDEPDSWYSGGGLAKPAKQEIVSELIAFANAEGGTLVIGIQETKEQPRRAETAVLVPRCQDLARRLIDICEEIVEPRLPFIEAVGLPLHGDEGFVVVRVGRSANGPHRLTYDGQFYIRRGERAAKMAVREIRDAVLDLARQGDRVAQRFESYSKSHRDLAGRVRELDKPGSHRVLISVDCVPLSSLQIPDITTMRELWWHRSQLRAFLDTDEHHLAARFPAIEFDELPAVRMRELYYGDDYSDGLSRSINSQGEVRLCVSNVERPAEGRQFDPVRLLPAQWLVSLMAGALSQIEHLRFALKVAADYGLQISITSNLPMTPSWHQGVTAGYAAMRPLLLPRLHVGPSSTFDSVVNRALRDVWDHCGVRYPGEVRVDWGQVLPG